jgi:hypothetical protein
VSVLVDRITNDAAGLRAAAESTASTDRLEQFWTALSALMSAESRAREQFARGDEDGAADAVLAAARDHVTVLNSSLRAFRDAESEIYQAARASTLWRSWALSGGAAVLWAVGLVAFAVTPRRRPAAEVAVRAAAPLPVPAPAPSPAPALSIDLAAAAGLCADISRLSDPGALPDLLARTAGVLDARGIVLWMGSGEQLFAVAAHGYDAAVLARFGPISRHADNAAAEAWRTGALRRVPADASGYGALVAPLPGPSGSVGVLAAEVPNEREQDEATRALAAIVASQWAGVLAASAASTHLEQPLDRKAAAS